MLVSDGNGGVQNVSATGSISGGSGGGGSSRHNRNNPAPNTSTNAGPVYTPPPQQTAVVRAQAPTAPSAPVRDSGYRTPDGRISEAPKQTLVGRGWDATKRFAGGFWGGFTLNPQEFERLQSARYSGEAASAQDIGAMVGIVGLGAAEAVGTFGKAANLAKETAISAKTTAAEIGAAAKATKAGQSVTGAMEAAKATKAAQMAADARAAVRGLEIFNVPVGKAAVWGAETVAVTEIAAQSAKKGADLTRPNYGVSDKAFDKAYADALAKSGKSDAAGIGGIIKAAAYQVSPYFGNAKVFEQSFRESLSAQGVTGSAQDAAISRARTERKILSGAEAATLIGIGSNTEGMGRELVTDSFEKAAQKGETFMRSNAFGTMFKKTFVPIAQAGLVEGVASVRAQDVLRGESTSVKELAIGGALGAGTAGTLGGALAGLKATKSKAAMPFEVALNVMDPTEYPGDKLRDLQEVGIRKAAGRSFSSPTIFEVSNPMDVMSLGSDGKGKPSPTVTAAPLSFAPMVGSVSAPTQNPVRPPSFVPPGSLEPKKIQVQLFEPLPAPGDVPTNPRRGHGGGSVPISPLVDIPIMAPTPTPTPVNPLSLVDQNGRVPSPVKPIVPPVTPNTILPVPQIPISPNPQVPVSVPVPITVPISIPVMSSYPRVPPIVPFDIPNGFGGAGFGMGKAPKYVNELAEGRNFITSMLPMGSGVMELPKPLGRQRVERKLSKKQAKAARKSGPDWNAVNGRIWGRK